MERGRFGRKRALAGCLKTLAMTTWQVCVLTGGRSRLRLPIILAVLCLCCICSETGPTLLSDEKSTYYTACVNITYTDASGRHHRPLQDIGKYSMGSTIARAYGHVHHVVTKDGSHYGCTIPVNVIDRGQPWIALVKRGQCRFQDKIYNAAKLRGATAVVVYNDREENPLVVMDHEVEDVIAIFIGKEEGDYIATMLDNFVPVEMTITPGSEALPKYSALSTTGASSTVSTSTLILGVVVTNFLYMMITGTTL
ncbi:E3 ubiquitin-protein ligase RNF130 [Lingula anatina]|uniref:E3 ubiquitin-protein ligase RNF130 n=1 Tax=Lingula anatina TaxID=7574 RepID=A0A1S3I651_LINAN|nr:E3 ubiquitin-protein ligase RNF130 [Lingula anatina]|eukprot:XP_013392849.1 E3 ubiquitin-protein ligase RNF130 [Lingula anatina]